MILSLAIVNASQALLAQVFFNPHNATAAEVRMELSAGKKEYPRFEPIRLHFRVTFLGVVDSSEADYRLARGINVCNALHFRGPLPPPYDTLGSYGLAQGQMPEDAPLPGHIALPGDSLDADFWIFPICMFSATGEYEIWIGDKECCWKQRTYESNHVKLTVVEPQGKDKEAFDFAKGSAQLLALMGGPIGALGSPAAKVLYGRSMYEVQERMPFWQAFVEKARGSSYHPFALLALSRAYYLGWGQTRLKGRRYNRDYSLEPDYELLLQTADEFLMLYPNHPLANEEHLFRLVALYGLGKKDEAAKECDLIHERLVPIETMLWEEFQRQGGREWDSDRARDYMEEGPLYVWASARKVRDLYEKGVLNGAIRPNPRAAPGQPPAEAPPLVPIQVEELAKIFQSRWAPW